MSTAAEYPCSVDGCPRKRKAQGLCPAHYARWQRHGDPLAGRKVPQFFTSVEQMIENSVAKSNGCWEWIGTRGADRYGRATINKVRGQAHRFSYEHFVGPIPDGYQVDHLCRNTYCVNPDHLEAVTPQVNTLRSTSPSAFNARKTHCIRGHAFTGANLIVKDGRRACRACRTDRESQRKAA